MPIDEKANPNFPLNDIRTFVTADGLDEFVKILEKEFFANITVQCRYHTGTKKTDLILDIYCNFGLTESLHHFNTGNWGGFTIDENNVKEPATFDEAFQKLRKQNNNSIDIAELSLHFKDTSVIVSRIYDYSIPEQLGEIIFKTSEHFVYFTKGLTEMPYEIFVPVFEDNTQNVFGPLDNQKKYFDYWGLYFEDDLQYDVLIYALENKKLCKEDFFLLD